MKTFWKLWKFTYIHVKNNIYFIYNKLIVKILQSVIVDIYKDYFSINTVLNWFNKIYSGIMQFKRKM